MIGQEKILKSIKGNGPFLITGVKGCGKTLLAKEIIKKDILKMHNNQSKYVEIFNNENYPDFQYFTEYDSKSVRNLINKLHMKPFYNKHYILFDDIDKMNNTCQNLLLKTIEEPLTECMFILTTSVQNKVLKTIQSRCYKITPMLLKEDIILEQLLKMYPETDKKILQRLSKMSEGSLGYAKNMMEEKEFYSMLFEDIQNIKEINFYETAKRYSKEEKENIVIILEFYEKFLRNSMINDSSSNLTSSLYLIICKIEKYKRQLNNNINVNMMFQNLILEVQKI